MSVSVANTTAQLLGKVLAILDATQSITGLWTFNRGVGAPFGVAAGAAKVDNLDADKLDGQEGTYYTNMGNAAAGTLAVARGGTGAATAAANRVFAGPSSGADAAPAFRALVAADLPDAVLVLNKNVAAHTQTGATTEGTAYSFTVPANTLGSDGALRLTLIGDVLNNTGGSEGGTIRVKFGGTTIASSAKTHATSADRRTVKVECIISAQGATNAQRAATKFSYSSPGSAGTADATNADYVTSTRHDTLAIDTTATADVVVTVQNTHNSVSFITQAVYLELLP